MDESIGQMVSGNKKRKPTFSRHRILRFLFGIAAFGFSAFFSPDSPADAPTITINIGMTVAQGGDGNFNGALEAVDADTDPSNLVFTLILPPVHGVISRDGVILGPADFFTQDDIDSSRVTYMHDGSVSFGGFDFDDIMFFNLTDGTSTVVDNFFKFTVTPVDVPPELLNNNPLSLLEGRKKVITAGNLRVDDPDTPPEDLIFTLVATPVRGDLLKDANPLQISDFFTQEDIFNGNIRYSHDGSEAVNDHFEFKIQDESSTLAGLVFDIFIEPLDDPPILEVNKGLELSQGEEVVISNTALLAIDGDTPSSEIIFTLVTTPSHGTVFREGIALGIDDVFTQADIDDGLVSYQHDGTGECNCGLPHDDYFFFNLSDGTTTIFNNFFGEQVTFSIIFENGFEFNQLTQLESSGKGVWKRGRIQFSAKGIRSLFAAYAANYKRYETSRALTALGRVYSASPGIQQTFAGTHRFFDLAVRKLSKNPYFGRTEQLST